MWGIRRATARPSLPPGAADYPRIIIAVALFYLYAKLNLIGTVTGLVLAIHCSRSLIVVVTVMAVLKELRPELRQGRRQPGRTVGHTSARERLPLLRADSRLPSSRLYHVLRRTDHRTVVTEIDDDLPKQMWDSAELQVDQPSGGLHSSISFS